MLLHLEGLTNEEIAAVLGLGYSNVGVRLLQARHALRERIAAMGGL